MLEIDASLLGTLEIENGKWVPYLDLYEADFLPTRITLGRDEYAFQLSAPTLGYGAVLPDHIRKLREEGKKPVIVQREDRYYLYVTPP
jgi:hypothetical protein